MAVAPEEAHAMFVVPLDEPRQVAGILQGQTADEWQPLVGEGLLDAVPVGEDGGLLLSQVHVQAGIAQVGDGPLCQRDVACRLQYLWPRNGWACITPVSNGLDIR